MLFLDFKTYLLRSSILIGLLFLVACSSQNSNQVFMGFEAESIGQLTSSVEIIDTRARSGKQSAKLKGGENNAVFEISLQETAGLASLTFWAERWTRNQPYRFRIEKSVGGKWTEIYNGDEVIKTGLFSTFVNVDLENHSFDKIRMISKAPEGAGTLIDDLRLIYNEPMKIDSVVASQISVPVLRNKKDNPLQHFVVFASGTMKRQRLEGLKGIEVSKMSGLKIHSGGQINDFKKAQSVWPISSQKKSWIVDLAPGENHFWITANILNDASMDEEVGFDLNQVTISGKNIAIKGDDPFTKQVAIGLRQHGDDNIDTYRIPGLATTNKGTLIAVYDNRKNSAVDLQEDVDIGMNRSTDGGETWSPMKVIMNMGEWGGLPQEQNGIGDPAILVDEKTGTIWVAALWAHGHPGERAWWASKQGMTPKETSQFVLVKSEDDGLTWSEPINITSQIKDPKWHLLLQGPGKGITMKDGTLVFPAQYKDEKEMPHATIIYSKDQGKNWKIGIGAKPNTTEAQVVELETGVLMLNMRDNRGGSRSIYTTSDMGMTWVEHSTSRSALIEPICMASLIKHNYKGEEFLLFSNPNSIVARQNMTIKLSKDMGDSWPEQNQLLLDEGQGRGYSCMTSIDEETIGILYEGSQADLVFQKIKIKDLLK